MPPRAILAGGSGFLGRDFAGYLIARGWDVVVLTRSAEGWAGPGRAVAWDAKTAGPWTEELDGADALVNFTGRSVNCVHTPENKRAILESRIDSVRVLGEALDRCRRPPPVWVQCASLAIYGNPGDRVCDETAPHGDDFSAHVCEQWEAALVAAPRADTRKVCLRIGLVLGPGGGALGPLVKLARWFLGGTVGSGRQYLSWIHHDDMNELLAQCISRSELSGIYNACTPQPVPNGEFMRALRHAVGRPWSPPAPEWAVRIGARLVMRTDADLALTGRRCVPTRLLAQGFEFRHPELARALDEIVGR
ncbi:MAG TPA: TIGR01777 family oxidoreductase [Candidatus Didemnitutus sp.]|nr:TIGR01777 family oxidoreductase [Candidatus Didemnitutus sp.]